MQRKYYIENTIEFGWNRNVLTHYIKTNLFQRDDKNQKNNNFDLTLDNPFSELATDMIKNEYNLEFLEVAKDAYERKVESSLIENIKNKDTLEVEYSFLNTSQPMGLTTYTINEMKKVQNA
jgi:predicted nuclease of restriction endonuclease-like (RecB) superfamily